MRDSTVLETFCVLPPALDPPSIIFNTVKTIFDQHRRTTRRTQSPASTSTTIPTGSSMRPGNEAEGTAPSLTSISRQPGDESPLQQLLRCGAQTPPQQHQPQGARIPQGSSLLAQALERQRNNLEQGFRGSVL